MGGDGQHEHEQAEVGEAQARVAATLSALEQQFAAFGAHADRRVAEERLARAAEQEARPSEGDLAAAAVREHLMGAGHEQVRILTDLGSLQAGTGRVVFESLRAGVMNKGHVVVTDGRVSDERIRTAYGAFP